MITPNTIAPVRHTVTVLVHLNLRGVGRLLLLLLLLYRLVMVLRGQVLHVAVFIRGGLVRFLGAVASAAQCSLRELVALHISS